MSERVPLEIFTDYICPWCYLCTPDVARLEREYPISVRWIHYPLHPDVPDRGEPLTPAYLAFQERIAALAAGADLPFRARSMRCNSRRAQELGKWADGQAGGELLHDRLYRAYFAENLDIADPDVLVDQAVAVGLNGDEARRAVTGGGHAHAVEEDWARAEREGIDGVPTFFHEQIRIVGAQTYEVLELFVRRLLDR